MGGLAEYSGSLMLGLPLGRHVCVAVQPRRDGKISIVQHPSADGDAGVELAASQLVQGNGSVPDLGHVRECVENNGDGVELCVLASLAEGAKAGLFTLSPGGVSIRVGSSVGDTHGGGRHAAIAAATLAACAAASERIIEGSAVAAACRQLENCWLHAPIGIADSTCALLGEPDTLQQVQPDPYSIAGSLRLPEDLALVAVDSGVTAADAAEKFRHVRTATFMGCSLIDRIIRHDGLKHIPWDGRLARLSIADFVARFRDRIPTKMAGREFLERFGDSDDPLTRVDPASTYKIRSRTEHHIYENARSSQFVETLSRAVRTGDRAALVEAGEVMYASHWSYGQRCGLGGIETDLLVGLIRRHGAGADVYGAKITGRGCGGLVAVLMHRTEGAWSALEAALDDYRTRTGRQADILHGSTPGALVTGVRRL